MVYAAGALTLMLTAIGSAFFATQRAKAAHEKALRSKPFPKEWEKYLDENVKLYGFLPEELQNELKGYVNLFVATKHFEGAGGLEVTDEMRVTVAALAGTTSDAGPSREPWPRGRRRSTCRRLPRPGRAMSQALSEE